MISLGMIGVRLACLLGDVRLDAVWELCLRWLAWAPNAVRVVSGVVGLSAGPIAGERARKREGEKKEDEERQENSGGLYTARVMGNYGQGYQ